MNKQMAWVGGILIVLVVGTIATIAYINNTSTNVSIDDNVLPATDMIRVTTPLPNVLVQSPLVAKGEARGNWYFEAVFGIKVKDSNGQVIGSGFATAKDEWMTTDFVPFEATINFSKPTTETGTIVFEKNNPSGLPENDASISVPVYFSDNASKL
jgi:hypothetical protein